ncbi:MAG: MGMT family protein [Acidilobaceae archaeon]
MGLIVWDNGRVRRAKLEDYMDAVYILLNLIPPGMVTSYSTIAKILKVNSRLIGRILALNRDLIIVPCHRVVRSNGSLGGYSRGVMFKRKLLELEGVAFNNLRVSRRCFLESLL